MFKQKTAYEMRINDWSSDVCSSDLPMCRRNGVVPDGIGTGASWRPIWRCRDNGLAPREKKMTADNLVELIVARLVRDYGRSKHHWRRLVGPIRLYSRATHPHCNWAAAPIGTF